MEKLIIVAIIILTSCYKQDLKVYYVDPILQPYVNNFYHEAELRNIHLRDRSLIVGIKQGLFKQNGWMGVTYMYKTPEIYLDFDLVYTTNNELTIEWVIFHEFGHFLGRQHNQISNSIMNITLPRRTLTPDIREEYINELFNGH